MVTEDSPQRPSTYCCLAKAHVCQHLLRFTTLSQCHNLEGNWWGLELVF